MSDAIQLAERIKRQIKTDGPLSIAEYMSICLTDVQAGYYTTATPFGRDGDFITAPEISQMFGELIGVWCVAMWRNIGTPEKFTLIELGPGRGTLMADLLRAASFDAGFIAAAKVQLVEVSPKLRQQQAKSLAEYSAKISWCDTIHNVANGSAIFIGNEFLDALAFRQYVKSGPHWNERVVTVENDRLVFSIGPGLLDPALLPGGYRDQPDGTVFEISLAREAVIEAMAPHIADHNGAALLIDYGHLKSGFGDTFQAITSHEYSAPLHDPGKADLTSHVDFAALGQCAAKHPDIEAKMTSQGEFLLNLGLVERAGLLGRGKSAAEQAEIKTAVERLAGYELMGDLFKVMALARSRIDFVGFDSNQTD